MTSAERYSGTQIALHWSIACLVLIQYVASDGIEAAWRAFRRGEDSTLTSLGWLHIVVGALILLLMAWRVVLRLTHGAPPHPEGQGAVLRIAAAAVHGLIYALLIALPISGSLAWFGGVQAAISAHLIGKTILLVLIGVHVAGALVQQFLLRSNVLMRMVP